VLDTLFGNVVVIATARALLLGAAAVLLATGGYILGSTVVRMRRGEWLSRAGPFESQLAVRSEQRLVGREWFLDDPAEAVQGPANLRERLAERDDLIERLLADRAALLEALEDWNEP
jgi:hypothetical protein